MSDRSDQPACTVARSAARAAHSPCSDVVPCRAGTRRLWWSVGTALHAIDGSAQGGTTLASRTFQHAQRRHRRRRRRRNRHPRLQRHPVRRRLSKKNLDRMVHARSLRLLDEPARAVLSPAPAGRGCPPTARCPPPGLDSSFQDRLSRELPALRSLISAPSDGLQVIVAAT